MLDELLSMLHLSDRFGPDLLVQPLVPPVAAHLSMNKVLVNLVKLGRKNAVQHFQYPVFCFHRLPPFQNEYDFTDQICARPTRLDPVRQGTQSCESTCRSSLPCRPLAAAQFHRSPGSAAQAL